MRTSADEWGLTFEYKPAKRLVLCFALAVAAAFLGAILHRKRPHSEIGQRWCGMRAQLEDAAAAIRTHDD